MGSGGHNGITLKHPSPEDAVAMHLLVQDSPPLDVNSLYAYLLVGRDFADTSVIATRGDKPLGFISGYIPPRQPDTLFVWQVAVDRDARGKGLARDMLEYLWKQVNDHKVRFMETTITPSNNASQKLFESFARKHHAECRRSTAFVAELFGTSAHEEEALFRIGPFSRKSDKENVA